ncbi:MAG: hypothetical protein R3B67_12210 [Phycisphaerales bacterium]
MRCLREVQAAQAQTDRAVVVVIRVWDGCGLIIARLWRMMGVLTGSQVIA